MNCETCEHIARLVKGTSKRKYYRCKLTEKQTALKGYCRKYEDDKGI